MVCGVGFVVGMLVVVANYRLVGLGPAVLGIASTKYEVLGISSGVLTVGRIGVNVGPTDTGLNLGAGPW